MVLRLSFDHLSCLGYTCMRCLSALAGLGASSSRYESWHVVFYLKLHYLGVKGSDLGLDDASDSSIRYTFTKRIHRTVVAASVL